uniref:Putative secreted protein n=1 Tax=Anopheles darlingi TaxID=43151 RepID=A0A2M4DFN4_ANODA
MTLPFASSFTRAAPFSAPAAAAAAGVVEMLLLLVVVGETALLPSPLALSEFPRALFCSDCDGLPSLAALLVVLSSTPSRKLVPLSHLMLQGSSLSDTYSVSSFKLPDSTVARLRRTVSSFGVLRPLAISTYSPPTPASSSLSVPAVTPPTCPVVVQSSFVGDFLRWGSAPFSRPNTLFRGSSEPFRKSFGFFNSNDIDSVREGRLPDDLSVTDLLLVLAVGALDAPRCWCCCCSSSLLVGVMMHMDGMRLVLMVVFTFNRSVRSTHSTSDDSDCSGSAVGARFTSLVSPPAVPLAALAAAVALPSATSSRLLFSCWRSILMTSFCMSTPFRLIVPVLSSVLPSVLLE